MSSGSLILRRWRRFKDLKRGYYALIALSALYLVSFLNPLLVNDKALVVRYRGEYFFPAFRDLLRPFVELPRFEASRFGQTSLFGARHFGEPNYRELAKRFAREGRGDFAWLAPYPYHPNEILLREMKGTPPAPPGRRHFLGLDNQGRDVFARLVYGFRISISFALTVTVFAYAIGICVGGCLGYYGGRIDLFGLRLIEIVSAVPFLYLAMILVSFLKPSFALLAAILVLIGGWIGISYYVRGEFYREKARDYTLSAIATGAGDFRVMFRHILPNALTPVITFAPFTVVGYLSALVSLDFLGLGLPPPTPSWGEMLNQGVSDIRYWWLVFFPLAAIFFTLIAIVFIGESVREAFDPKPRSRIR
jgi:microcin C transport system permease protein